MIGKIFQFDQIYAIKTKKQSHAVVICFIQYFQQRVDVKIESKMKVKSIRKPTVFQMKKFSYSSSHVS